MDRAQAAALLGVPVDADAADVQRAFLRAARRVHPDTLPDAGEAERRSAAAAFDRLLRARDAMLVPLPPQAAGDAGPYAARPGDPDGLLLRRVEGRGLGGSLVILALLAFLLVAIVTVQQSMQPDPFATPPAGPSPSSTAGP